ncbi:hypothetical protein G0Q06_09580 [Puniceicoccales bacterium CK1056]|uniref:Uncharacterized protein n=1 Tax=Oceanipulchritudo coccoides TaxID=2706888 RepID=A0A6B2M3B7_9BACT|nr:hypothetical protein [Oceanipulchritudo coccoides]NDV62699.1 hypothetical protein [Oceanipulchritudo coccoides]
MNHSRNTLLILLVCSVMSLLLGPVVILMGALSVNSAFIGGALLIIGALGLYAGMKALDPGE